VNSSALAATPPHNDFISMPLIGLTSAAPETPRRMPYPAA
jgi:hypothetical protein